MLRSSGEATPPELAEAVDAALLRDLAEVAGVADPVVSPIDLSEIQLSVGCTDEGRACLEAMARAAGVGALLIRSLAVDGESARLELRYFDSASSDEPRAVSAAVPAPSSGDLAHEVPALVRELFGIPAVAAPAEPVVRAEVVEARAEPAPHEQGGVSVLPWIFLGAGAVALTTGVIVGAVASDDFRTWKARPVRTTSDAEEAGAGFERLETRAIAANLAMVGGGIAMGVGLSLLLLELDDGERSGALEGARLHVEPRSDGLSLSLRGAFHEGR